MEQVKKIVEVGCRGIVKDSRMIAEMVTRQEKEIYLVSDVECPTYSFLMILSNKNREKNNHTNLGFYTGIIKHFSKIDLSLDGIFSVKKHHDGGYEAIYLWSQTAIEATILYCLGLRIWKKISSDRGDCSTVNSVLNKLKKLDKNTLNNEYNIRSGMESLPYGRDVKIISLGSPGSCDLLLDEPGYVIADKIADVNRDLYLQHDSAFDEMHRIAKIFGLSLPTNQKDWDNKYYSR